MDGVGAGGAGGDSGDERQYSAEEWDTALRMCAELLQVRHVLSHLLGLRIVGLQRAQHKGA